MSWQDVSEIQLRQVINDVDIPQRYTSSRLNLAWLVGASYVSQEFTLMNNYAVDLVGVSINPDPTQTGDQPGQVADPWMLNLTTLRTAIMMINNDMKLAANSSFMIRDVHMQADMRELYKANKILLDEANKIYDNIRMQYCVGVQPQLAAILTPINILAGGYRAPLYGFDSRDRMIF
jgi:hypothetical protein